MMEGTVASAMERDYTDINAETISRWAEKGWEWGVPIDHETYVRAADGDWDVLLTPGRAVPKGWFAPFYRDGRLDGARILGLASGGGQQMPIFAAAGACCTVLDYAPAQVRSEEMVAAREGYAIDIVRADMTKPLTFADGAFDLIFHPVSNCYVEDVRPIWRECFRVLRPGGVLLSGLDNGMNFLVDDPWAGPLVITHRLPFNPLKDAALMAKLREADDGVQFSHGLEEQIGGQLEAGFLLTGVYEDRDTSGLLAQYVPQYWASRSVKPG